MSLNWKHISSVVAEMHNSVGVATICLTPLPINALVLEGAMVFNPTEIRLLDCKGPTINPRAIRGALWDLRHSRCFSRPSPVVYTWAALSGPSLALGSLVPIVVAERLQKRGTFQVYPLVQEHANG